MAGVRKPEDLIAWQLAWELKKRVHAFTETGSASRDFKFRDAIREAARSAPDNISEGFYRYAPREFNRFLSIARGSLGEVRNQLLHARDEKYLDETAFSESFRVANRAIGATTKLQELQTCPEFFERRPPKRRRKPSNPPNPERGPANHEPRTRTRHPEPGTQNPCYLEGAKYPSLVLTTKRAPGRATCTFTFRHVPFLAPLVEM